MPWPAQSVRWAIDFTLGFFGGRSHLRNEVVERLDIGPLLDAPIGTLSKGQRKRALLAIGLLMPQPLLLADEPFDGLDLRQSRDVAQTLRSYAVGGPDDVPVDPPDQGCGARLRPLRPAERRNDPRRRNVRSARVAGSLTRRTHRRISKRCSLRSPEEEKTSAVVSVSWLVAKEYRELVASRAWWVLLFAMGPLVGVTFISAVRTYGEASGLNGTTAGVGEAFSPLIGIWAPTFSACEVAAVFLLPFVAIRLVSGDRQSGALKIEMQHPMPAFARIARQGLVLFAGWLVASLAPLAAALLWKSYGGSVYAPELATVVFGHVLNAGLTIALASAAAAITEHPSTAAIVTLSVTVGTWILNFIAAVQGGFWERLAGYTPPAMVAQFQHGLVRLDVVLIALTLVTPVWRSRPSGFASASPSGGGCMNRWPSPRSSCSSCCRCSAASPSWDLSENRMNSFPEADEQALAKIHAPLQDRGSPRARGSAARRPRSQGDRETSPRDARAARAVRLRDLNRPLRADGAALRRDLVRAWRQAGDEPRDDGGKRARDDLRPRRRQAADRRDDDVFRGHPLAVAPKGAAAVFYGIWPALTVVGAFIVRRRQG